MPVSFEFRNMTLSEQKAFLKRVLAQAVGAGSLSKTDERKWSQRVDADPAAAVTDMPVALKTAVVSLAGASATRIVTSAQGSRRSQPAKPRATAKPKKSTKATQRGTGMLPELRQAQSNTTERDQVVEQAFRDGKIAASERQQYRHMYDRDPISTKLLLSRLSPGPQPTRPERARNSRTGMLPELDRRR